MLTTDPSLTLFPLVLVAFSSCFWSNVFWSIACLVQYFDLFSIWIPQKIIPVLRCYLYFILILFI